MTPTESSADTSAEHSVAGLVEQPAEMPAKNPTPKKVSTRRITRIAAVASVYTVATLIALLALGSLAWGPVQFRVSEALCVLALLIPEAPIGLTLGCALANLANIVLGGTGVLGLLDVVFGSVATYIGAAVCWRLRKRPALALLGPVIANALIVPAYLPLMLSGLGFYNIPFTSISLEGMYVAMYLFGVITTGIGEAVVVYVVGLPLYNMLAKQRFLGDIKQ